MRDLPHTRQAADTRPEPPIPACADCRAGGVHCWLRQVVAAIFFLAPVLAQPDLSSLIPLYREALERRQQELGARHPAVARAASDLGLFLRGLGQTAEAAPLLRRALEIDLAVLGPAHRQTGEDLENLASVLPPAEALELHLRAGAHPDPELAARNLARAAAIHESAGALEAAYPLYRQALAKEEEASGPRHPRVAVRLNDLALLIEPKDAEPLFRRAFAIQEAALGPRHPETAATLTNLANALLATGRLEEAEQLHRRALAILEAALSPHHPKLAVAASSLGDTLRARDDFAGARRYYERALAIDEKAYGADHPEVAVDLDKLAELLEAAGRSGEARPLRTRARAIRAGR